MVVKERNKNELLELEEIADLLTNGFFVIPPNEREPDEIHFNLRKMMEYCRTKGKLPADLTDEERSRFIVK